MLLEHLVALYWCTRALTTIGDLPQPVNKGDYLFIVTQLLFGMFLFAAVLGHVANIVANVSAARKEFQGEYSARARTRAAGEGRHWLGEYGMASGSHGYNGSELRVLSDIVSVIAYD